MTSDKQTIRSVQRAIDILSCFSQSSPALTLTEIANKIDLAKSTVTRLLATLEANQFVERESITGKYHLGKQLYILGHQVGISIEVKEVARDIMIDLRDQSKETVNLYIYGEESRICIQQMESLQSVKYMIRIGQELPLTVGAGGKVLLAYKSDSFIKKMMEKQKMIKDQSTLINELNEIKLNKYAISIEEREKRTSAIAAPVFNIDGEVIAALSVSGPADRFRLEKMTNLKDTIVNSALEISGQLGYSCSK